MNRLKMKTTATLLIVLLTSIAIGLIPVLAVKPTGNLAGAETVLWNLSGDVMPVPPYGSQDIPGSDEASKLILNQPNGNTEVALTGAMKGLDSNTQYTVFVSNGWPEKQVWSVTGDWVIAVNYGAYLHDYTFAMTSLWDGTFTGVGGYPAGAESYTYDEVVMSGQITGNTITFTAVYYVSGVPTGYSWTGTGTIDINGYLVLGTGTSGVTEWHSTSGQANKETIGAGWPGLFGDLQTFTFTTDEYGSGSWHLNLRDSDFLEGPGTYTLSVWVNANPTILVSNNFEVVVD